MFFFIGGLSPRIKKLDDQPVVCPRCGTGTLFRVRLDHYLSLFFIPLFPVKKGRPFRLCENCRLEIREGETGPPPTTSPAFQVNGACPGCGRPVSPDFRFCPRCGHPLK